MNQFSNDLKLKSILPEKLLSNGWIKTLDVYGYTLYEKQNKIKNYICQIKKIDFTYRFYSEHTIESLMTME